MAVGGVEGGVEWGRGALRALGCDWSSLAEPHLGQQQQRQPRVLRGEWGATGTRGRRLRVGIQRAKTQHGSDSGHE